MINLDDTNARKIKLYVASHDTSTKEKEKVNARDFDRSGLFTVSPSEYC